MFIKLSHFLWLLSYIDDKTVVQDGNIITSRGPGTTFDFALKITEQLVGAEVAKEVAKAMLWTYKPWWESKKKK